MDPRLGDLECGGNGPYRLAFLVHVGDGLLGAVSVLAPLLIGGLQAGNGKEWREIWVKIGDVH
jgi:hypothetical protein